MRVSLQHALDAWNTCLAVGTLTADAQSVIAYRSLGMFGGWSLARDEKCRMVTEKPVAFLEANLSAAMALISGKRPDEVTLAWVAPLSDAVGSNRARLEDRGPAGPVTVFRNTVR